MGESENPYERMTPEAQSKALDAAIQECLQYDPTGSLVLHGIYKAILSPERRSIIVRALAEAHSAKQAQPTQQTGSTQPPPMQVLQRK